MSRTRKAPLVAFAAFAAFATFAGPAPSAEAQTIPAQGQAWEHKCDPMDPEPVFIACVKKNGGTSGVTGYKGCDDAFGDDALGARRNCANAQIFQACQGESKNGTRAYRLCLARQPGGPPTSLCSWRVCMAAPENDGVFNYKGNCYRAFGVKHPMELCARCPDQAERAKCGPLSRPMTAMLNKVEGMVQGAVDYITHNACSDVLTRVGAKSVLSRVIELAQPAMRRGGFFNECASQAGMGFVCMIPDMIRQAILTHNEISGYAEACANQPGDLQIPCVVEKLAVAKWKGFKETVASLLNINLGQAYDLGLGICYAVGSAVSGYWMSGIKAKEVVGGLKQSYTSVRDLLKLMFRMKKGALEKLGYSLRQVKAAGDVAKRFNVKIQLREVTASARAWIKRGLIPKPQWLKAKTAKKADALLLGKKFSQLEGVVLYYDPNDLLERFKMLKSRWNELSPEMKGGVTLKELEDTFKGRAKEYAALFEDMATLKNEGLIEFDGGVVYQKNMFGQGRSAFTGDHDLYSIEGIGRQLTDVEKARVQKALSDAGLSVMHGAHLDWDPMKDLLANPKNAQKAMKDFEMYWKIREKYAPGGSPLIQVGPDGVVDFVYDADAETIKRAADAAAAAAAN